MKMRRYKGVTAKKPKRALKQFVIIFLLLFSFVVLFAIIKDSITGNAVSTRITGEVISLSKYLSTFFFGGEGEGEFSPEETLNNILGGGGPTAAAGGAVIIGKGCTTALHIDWDCDGCGVGPTMNPDADDEDPYVNTPASAEAKYGSFSNINNLKFFLSKRGYTVTNIFFVDPVNGNDATGAKNDISKPYQTTYPLVYTNYNQVSSKVRPGDAIIFRSGEYYQLALEDKDPVPDIHIEGQPGKPIVVMSFPGEVVEFTGGSTCNSPIGASGKYIVLDGFDVICKNPVGYGDAGVRISSVESQADSTHDLVIKK